MTWSLERNQDKPGPTAEGRSSEILTVARISIANPRTVSLAREQFLGVQQIHALVHHHNRYGSLQLIVGFLVCSNRGVDLTGAHYNKRQNEFALAYPHNKFQMR